MAPFLAKCLFVFDGDMGENRTFEQYQRWIGRVGGQCERILSSSTTHLIVAEKQWKKQSKLVQIVLEQKSIAIVTPNWIDACLSEQRKVRFQGDALFDLRLKYKHESQERDDRARQTLRQQKNANRHAQKLDGRRSRPGVMAALTEHGEELGFKPNTRRSSLMSRSFTEIAGIYEPQKRIKLSNADTINGASHYYHDESGFEYNIILHKSHQKYNMTARATLTLLESNSEPRIYAFHSRIQNPLVELKNGNHHCSHVPKETALRAWRMEFEELTGISWLNRKRCNEARSTRKHREERSDNGMPNAIDIHINGGARFTNSDKYITKQELKEFEQQLFEWRRPSADEPQGTDEILSADCRHVETIPEARPVIHVNNKPCLLAGNTDTDGDMLDEPVEKSCQSEVSYPCQQDDEQPVLKIKTCDLTVMDDLIKYTYDQPSEMKMANTHETARTATARVGDASCLDTPAKSVEQERVDTLFENVDPVALSPGPTKDVKDGVLSESILNEPHTAQEMALNELCGVSYCAPITFKQSNHCEVYNLANDGAENEMQICKNTSSLSASQIKANNTIATVETMISEQTMNTQNDKLVKDNAGAALSQEVEAMKGAADILEICSNGLNDAKDEVSATEKQVEIEPYTRSNILKQLTLMPCQPKWTEVTGLAVKTRLQHHLEQIPILQRGEQEHFKEHNIE